MAIVTAVKVPEGERRKLQLQSPANLRVIGEIEVDGANEVQEALKRARVAQKAWGALTPKKRATYIFKALKILLDNMDEYIEVVLQESGKAATEVLMIEIFAACDVMRYYGKRAPKILKTKKKNLHGALRFSKKLHIIQQPLGVIGVISPWNGPFILSLNPTVQALLAGNAVLLKPSEVTPFSGKMVGKLFAEAGLPEHLLQVVEGDGETGAALVESGVDKICFTGSVGTGRKVALACAQRLIPCTLELGGKDPMVVCKDANIDRAAAGAVAGALFNTGQYCCGTERIYVVEEVAEEFIANVVERVKGLRQGAEGEFDVGAIFWERQMGLIERQVQDAVDKGAKVLAGGRRNPDLEGLFYEPTVLVDVTHEMDIMVDETFGPVLPIMVVKDEAEAMRLANDTEYGLSSNIWTRNSAKGVQLASELDVGSCSVNDMAMAYGALEAPFGGRKNSGLGQVNGENGLLNYTFQQSVIVDTWGGLITSTHYPYSLEKDDGMKKFMRFLWASPLGRLFT